MSIMKWDPLKDLFYMEKHIDKLIAKSFKEQANNWSPVVDIIENDNIIILSAELAGVSENDMEVSISDGILSISGVKKSLEEKYADDDYFYKIESVSGKFCRSFAIPANIDTSAVKASLKDGVLKIMLIKTNKQNSKNIKIKSE